MARKQADYLADLLEEDDPPSPAAPSPERERGTTLLGRESALARVASGEVRQVTELHLDPTRVRVWNGNARAYEHLNEENCRELIDSIIAEGGQKVPAVVRRVTGDANHDFEVIAGTRRHWSVSWLRRHSYPDITFVAHVARLDDEAAFRLADIENRARKDVSDLERARNYAAALQDHYGGHQSRMAERLKLSQGWLSKLLKIATLPSEIVAAFASPNDIAIKATYPLVQLLEKSSRREEIFREAGQLAGEQADLRAAGQSALASVDVVRRLLRADRAEETSSSSGALSMVWKSRLERPALSITSASRQGISVRIYAGSGASSTELQRALKEALERLQQDNLWSA